MGNMIVLLPVEPVSSLWSRSFSSPQLSAQHLAYVGQRSQPLWSCNTLLSLGSHRRRARRPRKC